MKVYRPYRKTDRHTDRKEEMYNINCTILLTMVLECFFFLMCELTLCTVKNKKFIQLKILGQV